MNTLEKKYKNAFILKTLSLKKNEIPLSIANLILVRKMTFQILFDSILNFFHQKKIFVQKIIFFFGYYIRPKLRKMIKMTEITKSKKKFLKITKSTNMDKTTKMTRMKKIHQNSQIG